MAKVRAPREEGPPISITVFQTADGWHHATRLKQGRLISGRLLDVPVTGE
ncbi:MAG TPA: hypothetical protein VF054_11950 [Micromonosporaceae bacterium]